MYAGMTNGPNDLLLPLVFGIYINIYIAIDMSNGGEKREKKKKKKK